jgi:hypothetical protein
MFTFQAILPNHSTTLNHITIPVAMKNVATEQAPSDFLQFLQFPQLQHPKTIGAKVSAIEHTRELGNLPEDWDGYGAPRIESQAVENAISFLDALSCPVPFITPHPNGTVAFEWESPFGEAYLEIGKTRFSFYAKPSVGQPILVDGRSDAVHAYLISEIVTNILFAGYTSSRPTTAVTIRLPSNEQQYSS